MGIPGGANLLLAAGGVSTYEIDQSLRFDGSSYLTRTFGSATSSTKGTWSFWVKLAHDPHEITFQGVVGFHCLVANTNNIWRWVYDPGSGSPVNDLVHSASVGPNGWSTRVGFRDVGAWSHIVIRFDTTQGTAANRLRHYYNGVNFSKQNGGDYGSSANMGWGQNNQHRIGNQTSGSGVFFKGYMAEVQYVDGQSLDPTDFGEYDDNGVWRPVAYSGTYGNNGFYLKFDPDAANGIGHDHSGNGNNWTATNFTTSGTGTDVMSDTPTNNFATLNQLTRANISTSAISNGSLSYRANNACLSTFLLSSGKWYCEFTQDYRQYSAAYGLIGVYRVDALTFKDGNGRGATSASFVYKSDGNKVNNNSSSGYGSSWTTGDTIGVAVDMDAGTLTFYKNGTSQGQAFSGITGPVVIELGATGGDIGGNMNFGQRAFTYTPPSGYNAISTANMSSPNVADGSEYFNTVLYTGNGQSTHSITGVGFQPNFSWVKRRNVSANFVVQDSVRGITANNGNQLVPHATFQENSNANGHIGSYDSDGFTLEDGTSSGYPRSGTNDNGGTYVAWLWKAGTASGSSNTSGSITSTVSASPTAGFSIVAYTGNGSSATVGHGLGVAPKLIFVKRRNGTSHWTTFVDSLGPSKYLLLNSSNAATSVSSVFWNSTAPTSTVFSLGSNGDLNGNNNTYVAYCFADVEGYSKIGSYTGNGSTDGPLVYCGFKPAWLLIKRSSGTGSWKLKDTDRDPDNPCVQLVNVTSGNESTDSSSAWDNLSNGFKLRNGNSETNSNGSTYIFLAFAEHPFGGDGVSPATAR